MSDLIEPVERFHYRVLLNDAPSGHLLEYLVDTFKEAEHIATRNPLSDVKIVEVRDYRKRT